MISPPDKLMNMTLEIDQRQISTKLPFRTSPFQRNTEHISASAAISTDIGLIKIEPRCHPAARSQPDQTVQGRETIDPDHGAAPKNVYTSCHKDTWKGMPHKGICRIFQISHKPNGGAPDTHPGRQMYPTVQNDGINKGRVQASGNRAMHNNLAPDSKLRFLEKLDIRIPIRKCFEASQDHLPQGKQLWVC